MRFIAGGTGRCGTVWFRHALERCGLWVTHETVFTHRYQPVTGPDGEVSGAAAAWKDQIPEWWPVVHLVRDPLLVIRSFLDLDYFGAGVTDQAASEFRYQHTSIDPDSDTFTQTVQFVLEWDDLWRQFNQRNPYLTARIEDLTDWREFHLTVQHLTGSDYPPAISMHAVRVSPLINNSADRRRTLRLETPPVTFGQVADQLREHPLAEQVKERRGLYGYV